MSRRSTGVAGPSRFGTLAAAITTAMLIAGCAAGQAVIPDAAEAPSGVQVAAGSSEPGGDNRSDVPRETAEPGSAPGPAKDQEPSGATPTSRDVEGSVDASVDYTNDAGSKLQEYEYPDDPAPAESIVATLCNLNRDYIASLRTTEDGAPVVTNSLRTMMVAFSDYLSHWDTLRPHYPEANADIDTAQQIYDLWDQALLGQENGDPDAAQSAMLQAEKFLEQLPSGETVACTE